MFYERCVIISRMREYLLTLLAAALLSSIICGLIGKNNGNYMLVKLICGLFVTITAISPLTKITIPDISTYIGDTKTDAMRHIEEGEKSSYESMSTIISSDLEAYILDIASVYGVDIQVEILLSEEMPPSPEIIKINGNISPYVREKLQQIIVQDLGVSEENQIWM